MIVLDSYAVLALLNDEPAAGEVQHLLEERDVMLTALGVAEVLDHLVRIVGVDEETAVLDLAQLGLEPAHNVDARVGMRAGLLRARQYHRTRRPVSLADCVAADIAHESGAPLATADAPLLELCEDEGTTTIRLPTSGR